jgi:hypothetical protein
MILPLIWPNLNKKTARGSQDDTKQTTKPSAGEQLLLWYVHAQSILRPRNHALDSDRPKMMLWLYITSRTQHTPLRFTAHVNPIITRASKLNVMWSLFHLSKLNVMWSLFYL